MYQFSVPVVAIIVIRPPSLARTGHALHGAPALAAVELAREPITRSLVFIHAARRWEPLRLFSASLLCTASSYSFTIRNPWASAHSWANSRYWSMLASFAQAESESISPNAKWGIRKKYHDGLAHSRQPYGYRYNHGNLEIIEHEAEIVRRKKAILLRLLAHSHAKRPPCGFDTAPCDHLYFNRPRKICSRYSVCMMRYTPLEPRCQLSFLRSAQLIS